MQYKIVFSPIALEDIRKLQNNAPDAIKKLARLLDELKEHPRSGTGKVER